jgi:hypothetical protein
VVLRVRDGLTLSDSNSEHLSSLPLLELLENSFCLCSKSILCRLAELFVVLISIFVFLLYYLIEANQNDLIICKPDFVPEEIKESFSRVFILALLLRIVCVD